MAHIFKKYKENQKGILVLSHQEVQFVLNNPNSHHYVHQLKQKYFIGVHYGGFSQGVIVPSFCDFYMGLSSVIGAQNDSILHIPLASGNFTAQYFKPNPEVYKYWDIINVSRNGKVKNLEIFFREIKKIYNLGYKYKVLLVCASREEENERSHFVNIADEYYNIFTKEERELFTLMRLGKDLEFKGLSKKQLSFFYQSSKVSALFSEMEGFPGVVPEALLTGLPVVLWKHQRGSATDFLDNSNSVLFDSFDNSHQALIQAVEGYNNFSHNQEKLINNLREDYSLEKIKKYFSLMYEKEGQQFDGELINTDDLVSRLPSHFVELPWANERRFNGHITELDNFIIFTNESLKN